MTTLDDSINAIFRPARAAPTQTPASMPDSGRLKITLASDVAPEIVTWTWPSRIPCGKLTVITGDPEAGKTFLGVDIVARITTGTSWPDRRDEINPVGDVLMLTAEDGLRDTVIPRLVEAGADLDRVRIIEGTRTTKDDDDVRLFNLDTDLRLLDDAIERHPETRIVLVDPIGSYFGTVKSSYRDADVRAVLGPVAVMAERRNVPVVCLGHLNKQSTNGKAIYRMLGSIAFIGLPRAVWLVTRDKNTPTERLLLRVKSNLAPDPGGLRFTIEGQPTGKIHWHDGAVETTADDALREPSEAKARPVTEAKEWLARQLADGPVPSATIWQRAEEKGFAERTMKRAKQLIGAESKRLATAEGKKKVDHWVLPGNEGDNANPMP